MTNKNKISPKSILSKFKKESNNGDNSINANEINLTNKINNQFRVLNKLINTNAKNPNNITNASSATNSASDCTDSENQCLYGDSLDSEKLATYLNLEIDLVNAIINLLSHASSCQVSDAMMQVADTVRVNNVNRDISFNNGVIPNLKSVNNKKTFGRVITGKTTSDDWGTSLLVIDSAEKGDIIFIDGGMDIGSNTIPAAIWGELTSSFSKKKGLAGTVIYGSCRDLDFLADFDYPVYSCFTVVNAGKPDGLGELNCDIVICENRTNYKVSFGDFIFADINGVVVIPKEIFMDVISKTLDIKIKELNIINQLNNDKSLSEIVGLR